jgi:two-component system, NarL family, nitrate/nitrite response regulator NarL
LNLKVLVADDLAAARTYLEEILADTQDLEFIGVGQSAPAATELALMWKPDAVILEVMMRGGRGIDVAKAIRQASPATTIIMWTIYADPEVARHCLRFGADFLFDKTTDLEKVARVLRTLKRRTAPDSGSGELVRPQERTSSL